MGSTSGTPSRPYTTSGAPRTRTRRTRHPAAVSGTSKGSPFMLKASSLIDSCPPDLIGDQKCIWTNDRVSIPDSRMILPLRRESPVAPALAHGPVRWRIVRVVSDTDVIDIARGGPEVVG